MARSGGVAAIVCDTIGNPFRQGYYYTCLAIGGYLGRVTKPIKSFSCDHHLDCSFPFLANPRPLNVGGKRHTQIALLRSVMGLRLCSHCNRSSVGCHLQKRRRIPIHHTSRRCNAVHCLGPIDLHPCASSIQFCTPSCVGRRAYVSLAQISTCHLYSLPDFKSHGAQGFELETCCLHVVCKTLLGMATEQQRCLLWSLMCWVLLGFKRSQ